MSVNILIGIGGTGAKLVEAVLHATAAGLGPGQLSVGFVDQDQSNGNVGRAKQLLATLGDARAAWRGGQAHRLAPESTLLAARVGAFAPGAEVWTPNQGEGQTLSRIFGRQAMAAEDRDLFNLLFAEGPLEQEMVLDEGYRGRPHLGAAAMASQVDADSPFWRALLAAIQQAQAGASVRLMLTGSVFGGTGAAGFPTLARLIRRRLERENVTRNVLIGGALMLPYFSFDPPKDEQANVARSEQLLLQSREAVKYYHDLFKDEVVFDELYFVGWNPPFAFNYHSPGSGEQANPALLPELIAAMGVCRFFDPARDPAAEATGGVLVCGREQDRVFTWADLPSPVTGQPDAPYHRLGQLLRFATAWLHWRDVVTRKQGGLTGMFKQDPWYKLQQVGLVDFKTNPPEREVAALSAYLRDLVAWAASIEHYCAAGGVDFRLWNTRDLATAQPEQVNTNFITVRAELRDEAAYARAFERVVHKPTTGDAPPDANALLTGLNERATPGDHAGLGRVVAAIHAGSALTQPTPA